MHRGIGGGEGSLSMRTKVRPGVVTRFQPRGAFEKCAGS